MSEADAIGQLHAGQKSNRPLSEGYELVGLVGQIEFARVYHQPVDFERRPAGDGGIDFTVPLAFTVDVKCARTPNNLLVEEGKISADLYVLAEYLESEHRAKLLGWEYGLIVAKAPKKDFGYGVINHYIARGKLRDMDELGRRIMHLTVGAR